MALQCRPSCQDTLNLGIFLAVDRLSYRWEEFTDSVVRELGKKDNLVYLLWGNPASSK